jgi:hypothetical protein
LAGLSTGVKLNGVKETPVMVADKTPQTTVVPTQSELYLKLFFQYIKLKKVKREPPASHQGAIIAVLRNNMIFKYVIY